MTEPTKEPTTEPMNSEQPHATPELWALASAACSDTIDSVQAAELLRLLTGDAAACRFCINYCTLHASLGEATSALVTHDCHSDRRSVAPAIRRY
jgi:hypothetical protein